MHDKALISLHIKRDVQGLKGVLEKLGYCLNRLHFVNAT